MRHGFFISTLIAVFLVSGCANMTTVSRQTTLPNKGVAIHLDAAQRVVYGNKAGKLCAEPSPDALQAYAASLGGSFKSPDQSTVALAGALSGGAAGLGLRTQAITLMRDNLYRICEAEHNGALNQTDVVQLLQRSQDLALGVLAIEQLTGVVAARQPVLATGANSDASANVNNTKAALDQAKKDESSAKEALDTANSTLKTQQAKVDELTKLELEVKAASATPIAVIEEYEKDLAKEQEKLAEKNKAVIAATKVQVPQSIIVKELEESLKQAEDATKPQTDIDAINQNLTKERDKLTQFNKNLESAKQAQVEQQANVSRLSGAIEKQKSTPEYQAYILVHNKLVNEQKSLVKAQAGVALAKSSYDEAEKAVNTIQTRADANHMATTASTHVGGSLIQVADRNNINKDTVEALAAATERIVWNVANRGRLTDTCTNLMSAYLNNPEWPQAEAFQQLLPICEKVITATLQRYLSESNPDYIHVGTLDVLLKSMKSSGGEQNNGTKLVTTAPLPVTTHSAIAQPSVNIAQPSAYISPRMPAAAAAPISPAIGIPPGFAPDR